MKDKLKRLFAAVHGGSYREHRDTPYYRRIPHSRNATMDRTLTLYNEDTGYEYEVEVQIEYEFYLGNGQEEYGYYDHSETTIFHVWHFREKLGLWHEMSLTSKQIKELEDSITETLQESYTFERSYKYSHRYNHF